MDAAGNNFASNHYVRSSWIAFFTLWTLWGLVYFIRHAFGRDDTNPNTRAAAPATNVDDPEAANNAAGTKGTGRWRNAHTSMADSLGRAHQVLFENSLLLLSVLTLNTFGSGATRSVMILSWIFFAFTAINAFTEIAVKHHFIRFAFNIIFYGVTLAIGGLAFKHGWF
ncbi:hypothetical protein RMATCC62417_09280 [Rhizopus microsporus]|nr:hypothetical protein RMATCC62417_09280 [Rhizopus microsporus]